MGFADFQSVDHAQKAMDRLNARNDLGDIAVSFATPPIQREPTNALYIRLTGKVRRRDLDDVFRHQEGFLYMRLNRQFYLPFPDIKPLIAQPNPCYSP